MNSAEQLIQHQAAAVDRPFASSIARLPSRFRPGLAPGLRMRVHVATTGPEPGNWLVTIDEADCRVFLGSVAAPDARLYTDSEIGASVMNGVLSVAEALASRLLDYDGDLEQLRGFGACFRLGDAI
jgi:hypothetical protein